MQLRIRNGLLDLSRPVVMGILNVTPDSFSDGGRYTDIDAALRSASRMVDEGARIIDVGGESTRPGSLPVAQEFEMERVVPVVAAICRRLDVAVSIDTGKAAVMRAAVAAGAVMVNDVYALQQPGALDAAVGLDAAVCLMHMQGKPSTMQDNPRYRNVVVEVTGFLESRAAQCIAAGIAPDRIVIDPGFGFGKSDAHNISLLAGLGQLRSLQLPILVGLSRKGTLGKVTGRPVDGRLAAGLAAAVLAVERGANIVRTHDVGPTVDALRIARAVLQQEI
ncbi:MAG TPA: dihydropteroate synthase [Woeseiaceae bacterium]|nr:dihydropteroate synthase [Woeseiaceae bacterium]